MSTPQASLSFLDCHHEPIFMNFSLSIHLLMETHFKCHAGISRIIVPFSVTCEVTENFIHLKHIRLEL